MRRSLPPSVFLSKYIASHIASGVRLGGNVSGNFARFKSVRCRWKSVSENIPKLTANCAAQFMPIETASPCRYLFVMCQCLKRVPKGMSVVKHHPQPTLFSSFATISALLMHALATISISVVSSKFRIASKCSSTILNNGSSRITPILITSISPERISRCGKVLRVSTSMRTNFG